MTATARRSITLERTFQAAIEEVWSLWTTKDGLESWWGPDGFAVEVRQLDLRPGGLLLYAMTAIAAPQIAFMKKAGMPLTTESRITFGEVVAPRRLAYSHVADFIPGVAPYDIAMLVELRAEGTNVHLTMTFDAMHDEHWTKMAVMGWENELEKLRARLGGG